MIDKGNPQNFSSQKKAKKIRNFEFLSRFGQDPDPDPGFSFSVGSGSVKKFPGSETLVVDGMFFGPDTGYPVHMPDIR